jgi:hypothetical protein
MEWPEGRLGMQERFANRHAASLPTEACNLWTQGYMPTASRR